jgi:hypothetical protein
MRHANRFLLLAFVTFFMSLSVASASTVGVFSIKQWGQASSEISLNALDSFGQGVYYGSSDPTSPANYLYASYLSNGSLAWQYNTRLPVNYVSNFSNNGNTYVIAGTGGSTFSGLLQQSYVIARSPPPDNATFWQSPNLNSSVESLGSAESSIPGNEDMVAGLENGTVICLSGLNGSVLWQQNRLGGSVFSVVDLQDGSVAVGCLNYTTGAGQVYRFNGTNGTPLWPYPYPQKPASGLRLTLIRKFVDINGVPEIIAVFNDGLIHVLNGTTGQDVRPLWPFNLTAAIPGDNVYDLLCSQDYTGDGFPDIVAGTEYGYLIIINGSDAKIVGKPTQVGYVVTSIQYMPSYENGVWSYNKTLAVSLENSTFASLICGVNTSNSSNLTVTGQISVPGTAQNLFSVENYTSLTGDLLFTTASGNVVYLLSGTEIITPEFPSQIIFVVLIVAVWFLVAIIRRERL